MTIEGIRDDALAAVRRAWEAGLLSTAETMRVVHDIKSAYDRRSS